MPQDTGHLQSPRYDFVTTTSQAKFVQRVQARRNRGKEGESRGRGEGAASPRRRRLLRRVERPELPRLAALAYLRSELAVRQRAHTGVLARLERRRQLCGRGRTTKKQRRPL